MKAKQENEATDWALNELSGIELGDSRLNERCQRLAVTLGKQPEASINTACEDWADAKAAYRFFDNENVSAEEILSPHIQRTVERMQRYPVVLAIQDTTYLNLTNHPKTDGLGEIGRKSNKTRGLGMHSTLVVSPAGQPLGFLTQMFLSRPVGEAAHTDPILHRTPIEQKESYRWIQSFEKTIQLSPQNVQVVSVCDREGDIYEMFVLGQEQKASLLVRACENRGLVEDELKHLWPKIEQSPIQGELVVQIHGNQKRRERQANVSIRFCSIKLRPPWRPEHKKMPIVSLQAILVREEQPPENLAELGHEAIEWLLLTNTPLRNYEDALCVIGWYCCRWQIEIFHKIIKSGCRVENCLLQTAERLKRYIALMSIVAWRLHWLTYINRNEPDLPCTSILTTVEWQALYLRIHKTTNFPDAAPLFARLSGGLPNSVVSWVEKLLSLIRQDLWVIVRSPIPATGEAEITAIIDYARHN